MEPIVYPKWVKYLLLNPFRRLVENPYPILSPYVRKGMIVLEPGCGPGYFTLPLARMVGPAGRVVVLDVQKKMLDILRARAQKAGLENRIDFRLVNSTGMDVTDLAEKVDMAVAVHMVHEVPDREGFLREMHSSLKPGGRLLLAEPRGHTTKDHFDDILDMTARIGFKVDDTYVTFMSRGAIVSK